MKKSTKVIAGSTLLALALSGAVPVQAGGPGPAVYGPTPPRSTQRPPQSTSSSMSSGNINWDRVDEDVDVNSLIIQSTVIRQNQLNKVLRLYENSPESWYSFKAPSRGMLRFTINPSTIQDEDFFISLFQEREYTANPQNQEQLLRTYNGVQSFNSFLVNAGETICWAINNMSYGRVNAPYILMYFEFIPINY